MSPPPTIKTFNYLRWGWERKWSRTIILLVQLPRIFVHSCCELLLVVLNVQKTARTKTGTNQESMDIQSDMIIEPITIFNQATAQHSVRLQQHSGCWSSHWHTSPAAIQRRSCRVWQRRTSLASCRSAALSWMPRASRLHLFAKRWPCLYCQNHAWPRHQSHSLGPGWRKKLQRQPQHISITKNNHVKR